MPGNARLVAAGQVFEPHQAQPFWYENSNGLVEIAVNQGRADRELGLAIGNSVEIILE